MSFTKPGSIYNMDETEVQLNNESDKVMLRNVAKSSTLLLLQNEEKQSLSCRVSMQKGCFFHVIAS